MSSIYKTISGDTFDKISRKAYGVETGALRIEKANPGVSEPLVPETLLVIPDLIEISGRPNPIISAGQNDEVSLLIDGIQFRYWTEIAINRAIDNMDSISFAAPFNPDSPEFRELFRPFSYRKAEVYIGEKLFFTGVIVSNPPKLDEQSNTVTVTAYSLPGVLNDCTMPASSFPLEFNNQDLRPIAQTIASPFGVRADFAASVGAAFERVEIKEGQSAMSFLIQLAKQRNIVITSTTRGGLLFWKSISTGTPVARLEQGASPVLNIDLQFASQDYYSHITGVQTMSIWAEGGQYTARNTRLNGVIRPHTYSIPDAEGGSVKDAVNAKLGRMFGNSVAYSVTVQSWRDNNGDLWQSNRLVSLLAPGVMIYNAYNFLVRGVKFEANRDRQIATLELVLPGAFSGEIPEALPWDE